MRERHGNRISDYEKSRAGNMKIFKMYDENIRSEMKMYHILENWKMLNWASIFLFLHFFIIIEISGFTNILRTNFRFQEMERSRIFKPSIRRKRKSMRVVQS